jgi:hypothetical protein
VTRRLGGLLALAAACAPLLAAPAAAVTRSADGPTYDPDYQWVRPPAAVAATNTIPIPTTVVVSRNDEADASISTSDRQLVLRIDRESLPRSPAVVTMTALDPTTLGALPDGKVPVGNAYRIDTRTLDGARVALRGTALLVAPAAEVADSSYGLGDASRSWRRLGTGDTAAPIALPETIVLAAPTRADDPDVAVPVAGAVLGVLVVALVTGLALRKRSRRRSARGRGVGTH